MSVSNFKNIEFRNIFKGFVSFRFIVSDHPHYWMDTTQRGTYGFADF